MSEPAPDVDPEIVRQLRHMHDAGGWVLLESAIADLPVDLRWLFESGAVTIEQLAALHAALGVTILLSLTYLTINLAVDVAYHALDPRLKSP